MPEAQVAIPERVIQRVAETKGRDPLQLPILQDVIDPDALETFIDEMQAGHVSFTYAEEEIMITSDGEITIEESHVGAPAIETREMTTSHSRDTSRPHRQKE